MFPEAIPVVFTSTSFHSGQDRDMQSTPEASIKHSLSLASGKRVQCLTMTLGYYLLSLHTFFTEASINFRMQVS